MSKITLNKYTIYTMLFSICFIVITLSMIAPNNHAYLTTKNQDYEDSKSLMANDALRYIDINEELSNDISGLTIYLINNKNLIPPVVPLYMLGGNLTLLYMFYLIGLVSSVKNCVKYVHVNKIFFILLLLFSPIAIAQVYGPNKEITAYISMIFLLGHILSGKRKLLFMAILFSLITRVELFLVILIFKFIQNCHNRSIYIYLFVCSLSVLIPFVPDRGQYFLRNSGMMHNLNLLDENFLYAFAFPFKVAMGLYGESIFGITYRLGGVFIVISSWFFIFLTVKMFLKNRFSFHNDVYLIIIINLLVFCTGAFVQHRYLIPVYPFFVYLALCTVNRNQFNKWRGK